MTTDMNLTSATDDLDDLDFLNSLEMPMPMPGSTPSTTSPTTATASPTTMEVQPSPLNPVLARLPLALQPPTNLACASCAGAVWMTEPKGSTQAYCRIIHTLTWGAGETTVIEDCSGKAEAMAIQAAR